MKTNKELKLATRWEVKIEGSKKSIQLFDKDGNKLKGFEAKWEGDFYCHNNQLTSLEGSPKEVGGDFDCSSNQLTSLEGSPKEVGGNFDCSSNQLTSLEGSPKEVGGDFDCSSNQLTSLEGSPKEVATGIGKRIFDAKIVKGYVYADGILEKLISRRTKGSLEIFKTRKIGSDKEGYVVKRGMTFSHGVTLKQAIEDLMFKVSDRDTSEYKSWKVSQTKNKSELIQAYRKITGACESGVKSFLSSKKIEDKMTIRKVIKLTEGHYGHNEFKQFFGVK
jgi:hypothetical protein